MGRAQSQAQPGVHEDAAVLKLQQQAEQIGHTVGLGVAEA